MPAASPFVSRTTELRFARSSIELALAHDLFSSAGVDAGSLRLLRTLERPESPLAAERLGKTTRVLDLGCGVGTLGLAIAAAGRERGVHVTLSDRDALAVHVTRLNAARNHLDVDVRDAGLGYGPVRGAAPFDVIVTNVPAKAGARGLAELLLGAGRLLARGGTVAFVHVTPISDAIESLRAEFEKEHGPVETTLEKRGKEHVVLHWRLPNGLPERADDDALRPFVRDDVPREIRVERLGELPWTAVHDVAEFDTPHFWTPLIVDVAAEARPPTMSAKGERVLVLNPAHGMLSLRLARARTPREIGAFGRDTLELAVTAANVRNGLPALDLDARVHAITPPPHPRFPWLIAPEAAADVIAGALAWREGPDAHATTLTALAAALAEDGILVLAVSTGQLQTLVRLATDAGLVPICEHRRRGFAAQAFRR